MTRTRTTKNERYSAIVNRCHRDVTFSIIDNMNRCIIEQGFMSLSDTVHRMEFLDTLTPHK